MPTKPVGVKYEPVCRVSKVLFGIQNVTTDLIPTHKLSGRRVLGEELDNWCRVFQCMRMMSDAWLQDDFDAPPKSLISSLDDC